MFSTTNIQRYKKDKITLIQCVTERVGTITNLKEDESKISINMDNIQSQTKLLSEKVVYFQATTST